MLITVSTTEEFTVGVGGGREGEENSPDTSKTNMNSNFTSLNTLGGPFVFQNLLKVVGFRLNRLSN